jgi:hypothetical protein
VSQRLDTTSTSIDESFDQQEEQIIPPKGLKLNAFSQQMQAIGRKVRLEIDLATTKQELEKERE